MGVLRAHWLKGPKVAAEMMLRAGPRRFWRGVRQAGAGPSPCLIGSAAAFRTAMTPTATAQDVRQRAAARDPLIELKTGDVRPVNRRDILASTRSSRRRALA